MAYLFDDSGWYLGVGEGRRSTNVAPALTSVTTTEGQDRSNWTGREWVVAPYKIPAKEKVAEFKRIAKDRLEAIYQEKLNAGEISGMNIESIISDIFKADAVISAGATSFAVVKNGESQLINTTKLTKIKNYWKACSQTAVTHFQAIQALTTKNEVKLYVQLNLKTLWPDPIL